MPLQATSGAASQDAFGGNGVAVVPTYIEDVFQTWLYKGNDSTQTITNGIDLAGNGGLVFIKNRTSAYGGFAWYDTVRGAGKLLVSSSTAAEVTAGAGKELTSFNSTGFSLGPNDNADVNLSPDNYGSWTFRKQPKFFDIVTYTGTGSNTTIAHSLGSVPACIIVKRTNRSGDNWKIYHRSTTATQFFNFTTAAAATSASYWNNTEPTSTVFTVGTDDSVNGSGGSFVAYLFAHNAGGFGLTGADNVISCGSFTTDGAGDATVNLGYEPQWLMVKASSTTGNWQVIDNMRGFSKTGYEVINVNTSGAASAQTSPYYDPSATGFSTTGIYAAGVTVIYIAIRRGPMKVPTTGTSVFYPTLYAGNGAATQTITGASFAPDLSLLFDRNRDGLNYTPWTDRLCGGKTFLTSNNTNGETTNSANGVQTLNMNGVTIAAGNSWNSSTYVSDGLTYLFGRAPSFMDVVCYTGNQTSTPKTHNLGVAPELMIVKSRSAANDWAVYSSALGATQYLRLNNTSAAGTTVVYWNDTAPTSTGFTCSIYADYTNTTGQNYVAYLFATCAGVSKCTSFTGNGTSQTINCGFTSGARFVMIKATSTTGNWTVFDSARGISAGGDPALYLNSTAAEVTGIDAIDADSTGFIVNQEGTFNLNASGVQYLVLAIA